MLSGHPDAFAVRSACIVRIAVTIPLHDAAHGFRKQRSIVSNAKPHIGSYLVFNCDVKDFFPTFTYKRVKGLFRSLGYSNQLATVMALLSTEPQTHEVELDGETF